MDPSVNRLFHFEKHQMQQRFFNEKVVIVDIHFIQSPTARFGRDF
jgi:hypothetical protein